MSAPDLSPIRRAPYFTWATWGVLVGGLILTWAAYQWAMAHRRPGDLLPGLEEAILGILLTAGGCFACGLTAMLRKEKRSWLALLPFLAGLGTLLYGGMNYLRNTGFLK